jgi:hypothetical protein
MKACGGSGGIVPPFLTSALDVGEWFASHSDCFTHGEIAPGTQLIEGWVGLSVGLDPVEKSFASSVRNRTQTLQPVAIPTELIDSIQVTVLSVMFIPVYQITWRHISVARNL